MLNSIKRYFRTDPATEPGAQIIEGRGRVTGRTYMSTPEGHRTTLVTGMADMLSCATKYSSGKNGLGLQALATFAAQYDSDALRKILDDYMSADEVHQSYLVAGAFLTALSEKKLVAERK